MKSAAMMTLLTAKSQLDTMISSASDFINLTSNQFLTLVSLCVFALILHHRTMKMLDALKAILAKVQNELTASIAAMAANLASVTAERDALKVELDALKASLGDLPQVETDLASAIDHLVTLVPATAA